MTKEDVLRITREKDIKFVKLWFTDILGFAKSFSITIDELEGALNEGMGFDGSSIQGFARIDESDMLARPDPSTFTILPYRSSESSVVARMFCDIYEPDGTPYKGDPRFVLKRNLKVAQDMGYSFFVGPELEFFYFKTDKDTEILDNGGYFDVTTLDEATDIRRDTIIMLEEMGIKVEYSHHEVAPSQHEIDLRYAEALQMADNTMTYRVIVKEVAKKYGVYATFMPKPMFGVNGSGMHVHQSLFQGSRNAFYDPNDEYFLSDIAKWYIAGLLRHAREITLLTSQWVNSYKRLVPGYEAPVYIAWARRNRSTLVRVPLYKPGKEKATRAEYRSPDPACNPYLAFSAMLRAGLEGIKNRYPLPDAIEEDVYEMSPEKRRELKIDSLPGSLYEAIECAEKSELIRDTLGDHVFEKLIENKKIEWDRFRTHVSKYEIDTYLPIL
ncbi:MAG TPA: glutamine synthetase family protein [Syntrophorhabdaceae bacterium]|nr:glutamine synthetase family protein [Syntrophorhabdaceae bacterium]HPC65983.1 glutamine synthetase family protein [Syntrophorhabdaceae bacterium]HQH42392.1 glutamine synthetase family protein [Syntrophorhabdaceae bacterium]HRR71235.1 glutamine synthetase family protein [Syntrophorhabdaceae bacterium]HRV21858.1 glutamine synthetase family protein [Syntrophorhabdaceae bacterium]